MTDETQACKNTDRELWRERQGDFYADSIFVTENGGFRGKDAGCLVDGIEHKHFPAALAA